MASLYSYKLAKCSESYSQKSRPLPVELRDVDQLVWVQSGTLDTKIDFFKMDRGVPIGIGAKKLREFDQLVWVQRGVKKKVDFFKRGL